MSTLFFALIITLFFCNPVFANDFSDAFNKAKIEGEVRTVYYARSADGPPFFPKANGLALGGQVGLKTYPIKNFSAEIVLYTTVPLYGEGLSLAATNLVNNEDGYFLLGKANLRYDDEMNQLILGRQQIKTPLVSSDDARVIEDLFNLVNFSSKAFDKTIVHAMYIDTMTGMDNGNEKKDWTSMSQVLGASYKKGMYAIGLENSTIDNVTLDMWYYDIPSTLKEFFLSAKYKHKVSFGLSLAYEAHFWDSQSRKTYENNVNKSIDYNFSGVRVTAQKNNLTLQLAYDHLNKKAGSQTIHTYFGNYAEYTYGFLMGSGAYGAITTGDVNDDMTSMDAIKMTAIYALNPNTNLYLGYNLNTSNKPSLQSDVNILNLALFTDIQSINNLSLALIYENWDSDGNQFFIDNHLIRATFKYFF